MTLDELIARESIRDLVARYNHFGDSGRLDQLLELFAVDAVFETGGVVSTGVPAIRASFEGYVDAFADTPGPKLVRHSVSTHVVTMTSGTTATGRSYYTVFRGEGPDHWGRYVDDYGQLDGGWRFIRRRVTVDGMTPGGWAAVRNQSGRAKSGHG